MSRAKGREGGDATHAQHNHGDGCKGSRDHCFNGEAGERIDPGSNPLLHESIQAEAEGRDKRDPRELPVRKGQHAHGNKTNAHCGPLEWTQLLLEHEYAEQDRHQRVDEVSRDVSTACPVVTPKV